MRVAQINVMATFSTGRIAVEISRILISRGHKALVAFSRGYPPADVPWIRVGNQLDMIWHGVRARVTDRSGFYSKWATQKLVKQLKAYKPDVIHMHNLHGSYLHMPTFFKYLREAGLPVVWTLHDCWAYTGHCAYYTLAEGDASREEGRTHRKLTTQGCAKWKRGCGHCPLKHMYPQSLLMDQSARNWQEKRKLFTGLSDVRLVTPSRWLAEEVQKSFLGEYPVYVFPNGIDLEAFQPCTDGEYMKDVLISHGLGKLGEKKILLGIASVWEPRKGLEDYVELLPHLNKDEYVIVLVGLTERQIEWLPEGIVGIQRTQNIRELCALYTAAEVHVNLSHEETMGMTLIEAMACGTQVLCYDATALPESVSPEVGSVVPLGDIRAVAEEAMKLCAQPKSAVACRLTAQEYDKWDRFENYVELYEECVGMH